MSPYQVGNIEFLRSGCDFDCAVLCSIGFVSCGGVDSLRGLYVDVPGVSDACSTGGGEEAVTRSGGSSPSGQGLRFSGFYLGHAFGCPVFSVPSDDR